jgi:hypothetical protein
LHNNHFGTSFLKYGRLLKLRTSKLLSIPHIELQQISLNLIYIGEKTHQLDMSQSLRCYVAITFFFNQNSDRDIRLCLFSLFNTNLILSIFSRKTISGMTDQTKAQSIYFLV